MYLTANHNPDRISGDLAENANFWSNLMDFIRFD